MTQANEAYFGFTPVEEQLKQAMVQSVFSQVAFRYDIMNDLMSGGVHRILKDTFVTEIGGILPNIHF